jgi:hypothetical protein
MAQFTEIMAERRADQDDTTINRIISTTMQAEDEQPPPSVEMGKLQYRKMPWEEVCYKAYKVRVVKLAMIGERIALKEACCIVLHALRGSRTSWNDEAVADQIHEMADKLERHRDIMSRLTAEYAAVPIMDAPTEEVK